MSRITPTTEQVQPKKPLVVVGQTGKPSLEIIRLEKENTETLLQEIFFPDFREHNPQHSISNPTGQGILRNLNLNTSGLGNTKSSAEIFKERIEEIDRELNKFNPNTDLTSNI